MQRVKGTGKNKKIFSQMILKITCHEISNPHLSQGGRRISHSVCDVEPRNVFAVGSLEAKPLDVLLAADANNKIKQVSVFIVGAHVCGRVY